MKRRRLELPKLLRDQIDPPDSKVHGRRRPSSHTSRKQIRKESRLLKKSHKNDYFSKYTSHIDELPAKKLKMAQVQKTPNSQVVSPQSSPKRARIETIARPKAPTPDIDPELLLDAHPEDAEIARLEKLLGIRNSKKGKPRTDSTNDLDALFGEIDAMGAYKDEGEGSSSEGDEDEESRFEEFESSSEYEKADEDSVNGNEEEESLNAEREPSEEEWTGIDNEHETLPHPQTLDPDQNSDESPASYIPPHLRNQKPSTEGEADIKLKRQIKGLLNRLSEQNIASILGEFEGLYRDNSRHDVSTKTTSLILDAVRSHAVLSETFVILHSAFVCSLFRIIGIEFAAHFVHTLVTEYDVEHSKHSTDSGNAGKECSNLLVLLSELYTFQVVSCILIYDIIRELLNNGPSEYDVELLLKLLRASGSQLRQDDPTALSDIAELLNNSFKSKENISSRTKFMVETVNNLKQGKGKRSNESTAGLSESTERLKKFLTGLDKRFHVKTREPLRLSLNDLRQADNRGKWWLVGSAWSGDPLVERQALQHAKQKNENEQASNSRLIQLAKAQGMNTDIRRSIFVILMTSEDYIDACERISQLHLSEIQQREIIRVLFRCCANEKSYNPYYTLVMQRLCAGSYSHRVTLQYCVWDFLRDLGEKAVGGSEIVKNLQENDSETKAISESKISNTARALGWCIAKDAISLVIFKTLDFTVLQKKTQSFLRQTLFFVFLASQTSSPTLSAKTVLSKDRNQQSLTPIIARAHKIPALAQGLLYIISALFKERKTDEFIGWAIDVTKSVLTSSEVVLENTE